MNDPTQDLRSLLPALAEPRLITSPAPWAGHTPFAMWLVTVQRPQILVELGSYSGISYLAFCQGVAAAGLQTNCYAVDTWGGDEHAGFYGEHIYQTLRENHDAHYGQFSTLLRKTFDEAVTEFSDASVDLLHIDGLHTYEAVRHDFETWLPKLTDRSIVLFHDTEVRRDDFGVWKFWAEIQGQYPSLSFTHSHGLGVLFVGSASLKPWLALGLDPRHPASSAHLQQFFRAVGAAQERRGELHALHHSLAETQAALERLHVDLPGYIDELNVSRQNCLSLQQELGQAQKTLQQEQSTNAQLQQSLATQHRWIQKQDQAILSREQALARLNTHYAALEKALEDTLDRRLRRGLRHIAQQIKPSTVRRRAVKLTHRARNALRYLVRGDFAALRARTLGLWRERQFAKMLATGSGSGQVGILTTPHTLFVAHALERALARAGLSCHILTDDAPSAFAHDFYIVLCAQMFTHLPPGEKRIVFQMEQTVSDRWFDARYLSILENSRAVLDYSLANLAYLAERKIAYPHVFHVPLGAVTNYAQSRGLASPAPAGTAEPTVLFYGDVNSPRRQHYLEALKAVHHVRIIGNLFGAELQAAIAEAQVVVNIHYYEGALLESTRIFECLSLGVQVVSETATDIGDYPGLDGVVRFVPAGDVQAMVRAVEDALSQVAQDADSEQDERAAFLMGTQNRFEFMFYRALLAQRLISFAQIQQLAAPPQGNSFALSLPETLERRAAYLATPAPDAKIFDGLRGRPGWVGCAMSYKYLCACAWQQGEEQLMICEDDVELPPNYHQVMHTVNGYLQAHAGKWDIFVGIIAHLHPDTLVFDVQESGGLTFVTVDKMTSTVFNIYSRRAMEVIAHWDETNEDDQTNTIDRYLERTENLRIVTLLEPVFGHREDLASSLWGFGNEQYGTYIEKSRALLREKVDEFLETTTV